MSDWNETIEHLEAAHASVLAAFNAKPNGQSSTWFLSRVGEAAEAIESARLHVAGIDAVGHITIRTFAGGKR